MIFWKCKLSSGKEKMQLCFPWGLSSCTALWGELSHLTLMPEMSIPPKSQLDDKNIKKKIFRTYSSNHPWAFWTTTIIWSTKFSVANTGKKRTQEYSIVSLCHIKVKVGICLLFTSYLLRNINSQHCTLQNNWPVWADRSGPSRRVVTRCNEPDLLSENKDYTGLARTKEEQQLPHLCGYFLKRKKG